MYIVDETEGYNVCHNFKRHSDNPGIIITATIIITVKCLFSGPHFLLVYDNESRSFVPSVGPSTGLEFGCVCRGLGKR